MYTNLKLLLWLSGIRQNRMAQDMEIDEALLSRIINGYRQPTPDQRRKIACYLDAEEEWLFARETAVVRKKGNASYGSESRD